MKTLVLRIHRIDNQLGQVGRHVFNLTMSFRGR